VPADGLFGVVAGLAESLAVGGAGLTAVVDGLGVVRMPDGGVAPGGPAPPVAEPDQPGQAGREPVGPGAAVVAAPGAWVFPRSNMCSLLQEPRFRCQPFRAGFVDEFPCQPRGFRGSSLALLTPQPPWSVSTTVVSRFVASAPHTSTTVCAGQRQPGVASHVTDRESVPAQPQRRSEAACPRLLAPRPPSGHVVLRSGDGQWYESERVICSAGSQRPTGRALDDPMPLTLVAETEEGSDERSGRRRPHVDVTHPVGTMVR
jgi:hypothetical protein